MRGRNLPIEPLPALHAKAVPPQVVMPARRTHQPPRRVCLQPPLVLAAIPDPVLGPQHPPATLPVEHGQVAGRDAQSPGREVSGLPLVPTEPLFASPSSPSTATPPPS